MVNSETPFVRTFPSLTIELVAGADRKTKNLPTSNEIAGIIPYEYSKVSFRDIRIYLRDNGGDSEWNYTNISQTHALCRISSYNPRISLTFVYML
jgi:hypothetical protein